MFGSILKFLCLTIALLTLTAYFVLPELYRVKTSGTLHLKHAKAPVTITREKDSMITHIRGQDRAGVTYG